MLTKAKVFPHSYISNGGTEGGFMYHKRTSPKLFHQARKNRHEPTPTEAKLWAHLRAHRFADVHFRRQHAIGPYIVDFCSPRCKLIIEVDGSPHLNQQEYDAERTDYLASKGYRLLRFWDADVMNKITNVMSQVLEELEKRKS
jgi:very-short-patch-repair endonuclease